MINVMHSLGKPMNQVEKSLDPQLWHACAGGMAQVPPPNSKVYYFPQGHAEHANINVDFNKFPRISPLIPCRVSSIKYLADTESDEVYAKIKLVPLRDNECDFNDDESGFLGFDKNDEKEKTNSFAKTLTQSDANNGGGFSVPRYCAETIFPRLDYSAEPPVQTILAKDVHEKTRRGDSIVFLRAENGDLCVGIRRAKRGIGGALEVLSGWNTGAASPLYRGFSGFLSENGNSMPIGKNLGFKEKGNLKGESVIEAVSLAASGEAFEWCSGMRFKMAFETEDSSRISWFMGTISSVHVDDPIHWPNSPWRLLQVAWDEPDLLQNVKRVNPWLVELGARHAQFGSSGLHLKKLQAGLQPFDFKLLDYADPLPKFAENPKFDVLSCSELEKTKDARTPMFVLFGQPILTADQISRSYSMDTEGNSLSDGNQENTTNVSNGSISDYSEFPDRTLFGRRVSDETGDDS
ncbi:hypothetical protein DH2020_030209 [Rehmannia glutinosa]|uniref:Auxin response factor domain-containing protein n=1 Tax=Rehmannia glutinosa TaxID=99300 RepID=A0ABR0VLF0_REHGL